MTLLLLERCRLSVAAYFLSRGDGPGVLAPWRGAAETGHVNNDQSPGAGSPDPAAVYRRFLDALNRRDLTAAEACVDPTRYRENCVGFTDGYASKRSVDSLPHRSRRSIQANTEDT
jgi:hypothetical protein